MVLALLYYVIGWVFLFAGAVGVTGAFVDDKVHLTWGIGCIAAGLVNIGLAQTWKAIAKITSNSEKSANFLKTIHESLSHTDQLRSEEARSLRDLLVKVAISAPAIVPVDALKAPKPVMFYYSGEDVKSRGPFSVETMRALIADGTVRADTPVALEGGSGEWRTYASYPELV
jgi:hypothetical protein